MPTTFADFRDRFGVARPVAAPRSSTRVAARGVLHPAALAAAAAGSPAMSGRQTWSGWRIALAATIGVASVVTGIVVARYEPTTATVATSPAPTTARPGTPVDPNGECDTVLKRPECATGAQPRAPVDHSGHCGGAPEAPECPPAAQPSTPVDYPWLAEHEDGSPVTWPCGPIGYRLVAKAAPVGATRLLQEAAARITAVSGLQFREDPPLTTLAEQVPGYNGITVAWVPAALFDADGRDPNAIGNGGANYRNGHYTHGHIRLLIDWEGSKITDFGPDDAGPVLLHEFGHAVGLGHIDDPRAVMNPTDEGVSQWSDHEVAALTELRLRCGA